MILLNATSKLTLIRLSLVGLHIQPPSDHTLSGCAQGAQPRIDSCKPVTHITCTVESFTGDGAHDRPFSFLWLC